MDTKGCKRFVQALSKLRKVKLVLSRTSCKGNGVDNVSPELLTELPQLCPAEVFDVHWVIYSVLHETHDQQFATSNIAQVQTRPFEGDEGEDCQRNF